MILRAELRAQRAEARARELEAIIRQTKDWAEEARKHADATIDDPSNPLPPRFHDLVGWLYAVIGNLDAPLSPQLPLPAELGRSGLPAGEETGPVERALTDERTGL
jgi:hypothetical protein